MEFSTKVGRPETVKADAVVVGVHKGLGAKESSLPKFATGFNG